MRDIDLQSAACAAYCRDMPTAVVVVDEAWRLRYANPAGEALIEAGNPLIRENGDGANGYRLALKQGATRHALRFVAMVEDVLSRKAHDIRVAALPCGKDGKGTLIARIASLGAPHAPDLNGGTLALCSFNTLGRRVDVERNLIDIFGMTPAESRASVALLAGGGVGEVAARIGVSRNTCKSHLKGAFAKTHTRGQAELLKLIVLVALA